MLGTGRKSNIRRHLLRVKVQNELSSVHTSGEHVSPVFLGQLDARAPVEAVLNLLRRQLPCQKFSSIKGYIHTSKSLSSCSSRSSYRYHPRQTAETPLISLRPGHLACCSVSGDIGFLSVPLSSSPSVGVSGTEHRARCGTWSATWCGRCRVTDECDERGERVKSSGDSAQRSDAHETQTTAG